MLAGPVTEPHPSRATQPEPCDWIRQLPKAELHVHLDGSLRPETLAALAVEAGVALPVAPAALGAHMRVDDAASLLDYLQRFDLTVAVMQTRAALERVAFELVEDSAAEGVTYTEIRFAPILHTAGRLDMDDAIRAVLRGLRRGRMVHGTRSGLIVCGLRHLSPSTSVAQAAAAGRFADQGVVAFDLAGPEAGHPASLHREAIETARTAGLALTLHAGEAAGPASVRDALACGATRLGHGTRLADDPGLMGRVRDRGVAVEVCLTSNVQTGAIARMRHHPLRTFMAAGIRVALSTDNRLMSGVTLTDEYARAQAAFGFDRRTLETLALGSFQAAFLPPADKADLVGDARRRLGAAIEPARPVRRAATG